jgi:hypothetical protein
LTGLLHRSYRAASTAVSGREVTRVAKKKAAKKKKK